MQDVGMLSCVPPAVGMDVLRIISRQVEVHYVILLSSRKCRDVTDKITNKLTNSILLIYFWAFGIQVAKKSSAFMKLNVCHAIHCSSTLGL